MTQVTLVAYWNTIVLAGEETATPPLAAVGGYWPGLVACPHAGVRVAALRQHPGVGGNIQKTFSEDPTKNQSVCPLRGSYEEPQVRVLGG